MMTLSQIGALIIAANAIIDYPGILMYEGILIMAFGHGLFNFLSLVSVISYSWFYRILAIIILILVLL